ncbi:bifunctional diguanylate cyclase/phosphodiesterase [Clostridium hydrogeniformans]|uniref:bifunctional diguanylate cyclase/phosphodiesterase n=1 Tax=Clostridium hydrogeniformans TaxID=349933 RepID=UPI00068B3F29|nr:EAL domain-containing protein [Clostridium hydrogeniformans]
MKQKGFISINAKISFIICLLCIMLTFSFVISSGFFSMDILKKNIEKNAAADTSIMARNIGEWINERVGEAKIYSKNETIISMDSNRIKEYFINESKDNSKEYGEIFVANENGAVIRANDTYLNISDREYFKKALSGSITISEPVIGKTNKKELVVVAVPINKDGKNLGVFGLCIDAEKIYSNYLNNDGLEKDIIIIDKDGKTIVHPYKNSSENTEVYKKSEYYGEDELNNILMNQSGNIEYKVKGENYKLYYGSIPNTDGWKLVTVLNSKTMTEPLWELVKKLSIIGGIGIILGIILSAILSNTISRPILNLTEVFKRGADGDLTVTADESYKDEIGEAAKSFNKMMKTVSNMTYLDPLTGLLNKTSFEEVLKYEIEISKGSGEEFSVMSIDVDNFKNLIDIYGLTVADMVLREISVKIKDLMGKDVILGRIIGDDFWVLIPSIESELQVSNMARGILDLFKEPIIVGDNDIYISCSIGISIYPTDSEDETDLLQNSRVALSKAKNGGKNNYKFYDVETNKILKEQATMDSMLHMALENNEFEIYYQPFVSVNSGEIEAVEALIRWNSPKLGRISPGRFIPRAEENGLIIPIGDWVMKEACIQNKKWQDKGYKPISISVNVCAKQFEDPSFVRKVRDVLIETGLNPKYLELEITETVAMGNVEDKINKLLELKNLGIRISIDDFGVGYSSLNYLKRFPIDNLKIDKSFVMDIENESSKSIISSIVSIGKNLKLGIVAEGVETAEQFEFIKSQNCNKIQGFLFSKPLKREGFENLLKDNKSFY